jgi:hypothetical protein
LVGNLNIEYEDELELELLDLEDEPGMESFVLDSPSLLEFVPLPDNAFAARVSGFDWKMDTAPPEVHDPGRPVLRLHQGAVARIVNEIKARTTLGSCVSVTVAGFADPGGESGIAGSISEKRANAIFNQIWDRLPAANKVRVKQKNKVGMGTASAIWPGDTHKHRALNRRVEVLIAPVDCGMTL